MADLKFDCSLGAQLESMQLNADEAKGKHCGPKNILIAQGSKEDRQLSENNTALLERVWILSRPPQNLKGPQPTVSARRVQIVRAILDSEFTDAKACPPIPAHCKPGAGTTDSASSTRASSKSISING